MSSRSSGIRIFKCHAVPRGGQESIFEDGLDGAWDIKIRRKLNEDEADFLDKRYSQLDPESRKGLIENLTHIRTGEMVPFYIFPYGFYKVHTAWRADPIAISFIFCRRSIQELEGAFPGRLDKVFEEHFIREQRKS